MGDAQPWRRMLPHNPRSTRPRTPMQLTFDENDARDYSDRSEHNSLLLAPEPVHPKRHSRPKFFTRASQYFGSAKERPHDRFSQTSEKHQPKDFEYTNLDVVIDNVFTHIASNLGKPLSPQNNEPVLRILEAYRDMKAEESNLKSKLTQAQTHCNTILDTLEGERKRWKEDEANYKDEIKKLEVLIANGKVGLSEVALARQQSLLRRERSKRPTTATVNGNREKTCSVTDRQRNYGPNVQRVTRAVSPSLPMSLLSESLLQEVSHLADTIAYGTHPRTNSNAILNKVKLPPQWAKPSNPGSWTKSDASTQLKSVDSLSDFSSNSGDLLPDEIEQDCLTAQAIQHVAKLIAMANNSTVDDIVDILTLSMTGRGKVAFLEPTNSKFPEFTPTHSRRSISPDRSSKQSPNTQLWHTISNWHGTNTPHIHAPQHITCRPFSFYFDDEKQGHGQCLNTIKEPFSSPVSASTSEGAVRSTSKRSLLRNRSPSMIPSPVLDHPLARPRRAEREDSTNSLVTSFQRSPCGSMINPGRSVSGSSNVTAIRKNSGAAVKQTANASLGQTADDNLKQQFGDAMKEGLGGSFKRKPSVVEAVRQFSGETGTSALTATGFDSVSESSKPQTNSVR